MAVGLGVDVAVAVGVGVGLGVAVGLASSCRATTSPNLPSSWWPTPAGHSYDVRTPLPAYQDSPAFAAARALKPSVPVSLAPVYQCMLKPLRKPAENGCAVPEGLAPPPKTTAPPPAISDECRGRKYCVMN